MIFVLDQVSRFDYVEYKIAYVTFSRVYANLRNLNVSINVVVRGHKFLFAIYSANGGDANLDANLVAHKILRQSIAINITIIDF